MSIIEFAKLAALSFAISTVLAGFYVAFGIIAAQW
jgi:hypothetical protein